MPTFSQLGDVALQGLSSLFRFLKEFFLYLFYVGRNESAVDNTRTDYQSFWEIWYNVTAMFTWLRKMLFDPYGFVWDINYNQTLMDSFRDVVAVAAGNGTTMLGDAFGRNGITFILRAMTERVYNNPDFVQNFWGAIKNLVLLVQDALRLVPTVYFPP
jgi:hypothetical protein